MLNSGPTFIGGQQQEESVEELLKKLAKKGKKVKLLDETASVRELPRQEDDDCDLDRDMVEDIEEIDEEVVPSSVKKKFKKIKQQRDHLDLDDDVMDNGHSAQKLMEQQQ